MEHTCTATVLVLYVCIYMSNIYLFILFFCDSQIFNISHVTYGSASDWRWPRRAVPYWLRVDSRIHHFGGRNRSFDPLDCQTPCSLMLRNGNKAYRKKSMKSLPVTTVDIH